ncbi:MAG TPA: hypothetical protein ENI31_01530 [Candidatus Omnitrophica bacterium]|nr:hypothetical protein [Candidatus Omnitrophota bacterium]
MLLIFIKELFENFVVAYPKRRRVTMKSEFVKVKLIKFKTPRYVSCPFCNKSQPFKKQKEHYKTVKDINIKEPVLLKVRVVYAKCKNPECTRRCFPLPTPGFERYQKANSKLKNERKPIN